MISSAYLWVSRLPSAPRSSKGQGCQEVENMLGTLASEHLWSISHQEYSHGYPSRTNTHRFRWLIACRCIGPTKIAYTRKRRGKRDQLPWQSSSTSAEEQQYLKVTHPNQRPLRSHNTNGRYRMKPPFSLLLLCRAPGTANRKGQPLRGFPLRADTQRRVLREANGPCRRAVQRGQDEFYPLTAW